MKEKKGLQITADVHQKLVDAARPRHIKWNEWASFLLNWALDEYLAGRVPDTLNEN